MSQAELDRTYSAVATLIVRDLAVRYDLVTDDGTPDPRYVGKGGAFRLVTVTKHLPQFFGYGSALWETHGGALLLGLLEERSGLLKKCADQGESAGRCKEGARLRVALVGPPLAISSFLGRNSGIDGSLTALREGG